MAAVEGRNVTGLVIAGQHKMRRTLHRQRRKLRQRQLFRRPERMILRQRQGQERLKRPIRRARRIVVLRHHQIRIGVTYRKEPVRAPNRLI
ncbi:hypothetical protein D3C81_1801030 [compost metagenome]